jgi:hypothetical protein
MNNPVIIPTNTNKSIFNVLFAILTAGALVVAALYIHPVASDSNFMNAFALATTVNKETFTELYFQNHLTLPNKIVPKKTYSFSFTIHNLENRDMNYPYKVYFIAGDEKLLIDQGYANIKNKQSESFDEYFMVDSPIIRNQIVVELPSKNQQIDFWVEGEE